MFGLFNGVVQPYRMLPVFWRYWIYYVNPSTYWIGGMLATTLSGSPVRCDVSETARFDTPGGQTCQEYAGTYASSAGGYLLNPDARADCQYCPYSSGDQYLATLNINANEKWRGKSSVRIGKIRIMILPLTTNPPQISASSSPSAFPTGSWCISSSTPCAFAAGGSGLGMSSAP